MAARKDCDQELLDCLVLSNDDLANLKAYFLKGFLKFIGLLQIVMVWGRNRLIHETKFQRRAGEFLVCVELEDSL